MWRRSARLVQTTTSPCQSIFGSSQAPRWSAARSLSSLPGFDLHRDRSATGQSAAAASSRCRGQRSGASSAFHSHTRAFSLFGWGAAGSSGSEDQTPAHSDVLPDVGVDGVTGPLDPLSVDSSLLANAADTLAMSPDVIDSAVTALSAQSALEGAGIGPVTMAMRYVEAFHIYAGLPWWGSILTASFIMRICLSPLYFSSIRHGMNMKVLQPQTQKLQARLKWAKEVGDTHTQQATVKEMQDLFKRNNVSPLRPIAGALVQIPIFISLIWAIRRMLDNAADFEGLTTGGMAWFTELTAYDPTFAFPIATAVVNISAIQMNQNIQDSPMMSAKTAKNVFRFMSAAFVPLTATLPVGMHLSFFVTACVMFTQVASTNILAVRKFWGLPEEWPVKVENDPNAPAQKPSVSLFSGPQSTPPPPPPPSSATVIDAESVDVTPSASAATEEAASSARIMDASHAQQRKGGKKGGKRKGNKNKNKRRKRR